MDNKYLMTVFIALVVVLIVYQLSSTARTTTIVQHVETNPMLKQLLKQRNDLSRALNMKQKILGQLECEARNSSGRTSNTGGWCKKASTETAGVHYTDTQLATALAEFFKGKYVASFGDGPGRYKQLLTDSGQVKGYDAYDGAPFCEVTSEGRVQFLDLTLPQYGLPVYDWVVSLEVAEHIPKQFENIYIDNIVRHAREGVVLSWARPGQGGYSHVNNQPFEYVKKVFEDRGFTHDEKESKKFQTAATLPWFKGNTNVYRRKYVHLIDQNTHDA